MRVRMSCCSYVSCLRMRYSVCVYFLAAWTEQILRCFEYLVFLGVLSLGKVLSRTGPNEQLTLSTLTQKSPDSLGTFIYLYTGICLAQAAVLVLYA